MPPKKKKKDLSFEEALKELETMAEMMESGKLPLEDLITNYERGATLINHCESVLGKARKRLELIILKPNTTNGDSPSTEISYEASTESNDNNDDEIRLF